jgi:hypothetical protein
MSSLVERGRNFSGPLAYLYNEMAMPFAICVERSGLYPFYVGL